MGDRAAGLLRPAAAYGHLAAMWVRSSLAYPASFAVFLASAFLVNALDFVSIWIFFGHLDELGGFTLTEVAFLYGATGLGIGVADLLCGNVERLGTLVRTGRLDSMMVRPVPLVVQVCVDQFAVRRVGRILQAGAVLAWACLTVDWTPARALVTVSMVVSGGLIFLGLFVTFATVQFWTVDASEVGNAFTYGGTTVTQYPLTLFPRELLVTLTFVLPLAFVNWYPALFVLGREDPFGMPSWLQHASPLAALTVLAVTALVWRTGVRHYTSTGS